MNPIDTVKAKITKITPGGKIILEANYYNWALLEKRGYKEAYVEFIDSRPLSDKQRKACWAMVGEIAEWMGQTRGATQRDLVNEGRKIDFLVNEIGQNADRLFSLSNAPMSLVAAYQKYLVHFIIENDIPTKYPLLNYVDDIGDYVYYSMINKKCVVCGRAAGLHHIDRVGMGNNRDEIIHEGMEAISVCMGVGSHHDEAHTIGDTAFFEKYHLDSGIVLDKTLCRIYKLKKKGENL
jgi:hypothetical protein